MKRPGHRAAARAASILTGALLLALPSFALAEIPSTAEAREAALQGLHWRHEGKYEFEASRSSITLSADLAIVRAAEAVAFYEAINGLRAPASLEAVVLDPKSESFVIFKSIREGYVKFDDWSDVDADEFLQSMREGNENANKERIKHNATPVTIVGWRQKPMLDTAGRTVKWAVDVRDGNDAIVNANVLIFGRYGYEQLTWVGEPVDDPEVLLQRIRAVYDFDAGARYGDFQPSDKVATYGIATLVAGLVGAKVAAKFGLLALALVFLKKAWIIVLVALSGIGAWLKRLARGRGKPS